MNLSRNNNNKVIHNIAKASLKESKIKNIFMILTISLAICFIMVLGLASLNYKTYEREIVKGMQDCIYYDVSKDQINNLQANENVGCAMEYRSGFEKETGDIKIKPIYYDYEIQEMSTYKLLKGNFPNKENEVVIDVIVAKELGIQENIGETIEILGEKFIISGFIDYGKAMYYPTFFSKEYSESGVLFKNSTLDALIKVSPNMKIPSTTYIKDFFYELGKTNGIERKNINPNNRFVDTFSINMQELQTFIGLSIVVLIISGIVIYSIFYLSVSSKVKEYAQLRTIGMSKKQIKKLIKFESLEYCKIAIPLGIVVGSIISYFVSSNGWNVLNALKLAIVSCILGTIAVFISVTKPAKRASNVSPIEGLRYTGNNENIKGTNKLCRNLTPNSLGKIEFNRNRKKTNITLISLIIGGTLFIGVLTFTGSINSEKYARNGYFKDCEYNLTFSIESLSDSKNGIYDLVSKGNTLTKIKEELEKLEEIDYITDRKTYLVKLDTKNDVINEEIEAMSEEFQEAMTKSLKSGTGDIHELTEKSEVYLGYSDVFEEVYGYIPKVGDKITIHYFNGEDKTIELTIGGVGDSEFSKYVRLIGWVLIPQNIYNQITEGIDSTSYLEVTTKNHIYNENIDNKVKSIVQNYEDISCTTYSEWHENAQKSAETFKNGIIGISAFIVLFSVINLINTVITSMVTRRKEIAILQSMGMTRKQVNKMIISENIWLAVPNCLASSIIGPSFAYGVIKIFEEFGMNYMEFKLPVLAIFAYLLISILIPSIIAIGCIKIFNKESIVDRLRQN